jgi:hypothetical protein
METETFDQSLTTVIKTSFIYLFLILNIELGQVGYLLILIFVDSLFGVARALKLNEGLSFQVFIWGIGAKIGILLIPFLVAGFGLVFKIELIWLVKAFIYIIAVNDLVSIFASIISIKTKVRHKSVDFIEKGIHALMTFFSRLASRMVDTVNKPDDEAS